MHDMTGEDLAALGHFVRRWTRAQPLNHARMIAQPEAMDYRAMLAHAVAARRGYRPALALPMVRDWMAWMFG